MPNHYVCISLTVGVLITTHPQDELVGITDSVNFTCEASGSPPVNYRWLYNGDYIMDDPGHVEGVNSDTLMIVNVTVTDVGVYSCEANNIVNNATSNEATLHGKCFCVCMCMCMCACTFVKCFCVHTFGVKKAQSSKVRRIILGSECMKD